MDYKRFWDDISAIETIDYDDEYINRALRFKVLEDNLEGVETILDIGAGTGAFSIPLAKKGYKVTHFDISPEMIRLAKENAKDLTNISFIEGDASSLPFEDDSFDLVICFDGAISFSGRNADKVLSEIIRTGKRILVSASNKGCMSATWPNYSLSKGKGIHPSVRDMLEKGFFDKADYEDADELTAIKELKAYTPKELREILEKSGLEVKECRSIGSLTHLYLMHLYRAYPEAEVNKKINEISRDPEFIELCDYYDRFVMPEGPGSFRRAGVIAAACKKGV